MIPFSKKPIAFGACKRLASAKASSGSRMPTKMTSPSRIARERATTMSSAGV